ncbi:radical SAM protein [Kitasatospora sp. NPDC093102]|uniref:radical SAM protein n=1 Tax=Kitasatospora sp. NPDC093102 TaxID=3155069 RepID=UPI00343D047D
MHDLIASPFLDGYLLVRPGGRGGLRLPWAKYEDLRALGTAETAPSWLADAVRAQWADLDVTGRPASDFLLVRQPSTWGYSRASWEINLGCNYKCKHCYLGLKVNSGMPLADKLTCVGIMAEAGVLWLQITGGEPTVDRDFMPSYRRAFELGMMITVSTNASLLWRENLLEMFRECPPYRVTVSMYGATKASYDELTQRQGAWDLFIQGMNAARRARLPLRMSIIVTEDNATEEQAMIGLCEGWDLEYNVFTNMTPTIYGGAESLTAQSKEHLRMRRPFGGCNAGHTFSSTPTHTGWCPSARSAVTTRSVFPPRGSTASPGSAPSPIASCFAPVAAPAASSQTRARSADRWPSTTRRRRHHSQVTASTGSRKQGDMTAVAVELSPRRPLPDDGPAQRLPYLTRRGLAPTEPITEIVGVADLDDVMDSVKCSCNAGDDNPH